MKTVFVQIKCVLGETYTVAAEIADTLPEVRFVYSTSGQYDLLAQFQLSPEQEIGRFVNDKVQRLEGVADTYTIIGLNAFTADSGPAGVDPI